MNKAWVAVIILSFALTSCNMLKKGRGGKDEGQIVGKTSTSWLPKRPKGMVPIPSGSFILGQTDFDFTFDNSAPVRTVSVSGFFMDDAETTNSEYHVFVEYVRDSIARTMLAEKAASLGYDPTSGSSADATGIAAYRYISGSEDGEKTPWDEYVESQSTGRSGDYSIDQKKLNWDAELYWNKYEYPDVDYAETIDQLYYPPEDRFNDERLIDVRKLSYKYSWVDQESAAKASNDPGAFRKDFRYEEEVAIYPDTTVWVRDFSYAHNDPMHENYYWHEAYSKYPVVGVNWKQAMAYCAFKTKKQNDYLAKRRKRKGPAEKVIVYRLPSEIEWEYAARGGLQAAPYPWGGPYLIDDRGCYLANFKPKRGDYIEEPGKGYMYTAPAKTFHANGYGLYDMAGNVAEWTSSPYEKAFYQMTSTLNPTSSPNSSENKVVRGGSWKDIGYLLMVSARDWEHQDSARSYIGFRTVQSYPEGSKVKFRKKR
ncbi:MAG: gliding motility lipoprotein GldK [Weeksellaceae bacterium]|jgi:gliding motility-associated lipoprotein GldK|nr:gliding motility lipoprotein GldK [Weeksellaceae bacterium]